MLRLFQRWSFGFLVACLLLVPAFRAATPGELLPAVDDRWHHLRSPNFELYTHNPEHESRKLLHDLELLRALFLERFKLVERSRVEVTVFSFRRADDFFAYAEEDARKVGFRGFYLPMPDRAVINLAPIDNWEQAQRLVFHEYVHHLFRVVEQEPPVWFNEGMAELLAAIREAGEELEIGRPHPARIMTLQSEKLLPLETLFAVDHGSPIYRSKEHTGLFYAQSWALLHFWHFGESGFSKDAVARFTRVAGDQRLAEKTDMRALFRECFGMGYAEMERRLERYVRSGAYRFGRQPRPKIAPASSYVARVVPREEIRVRLAELAVRVKRSAAGHFVLLDAAARRRVDPRVFEALGTSAMLENDEAKAKERWEQALEAGSTNPAIFRELGLLESRTWLREFDYDFRLPAETAERIRSRLLKTIAHEPEQTAGYEMLAWVEAFAEQPVVANVNTVQQRFPTLRKKASTVVALALVRARLGDKAAALGILDELEKLEWDETAAQAGEQLRARLEDRMPRSVRRREPGRAIEVELKSKAEDVPQMKVPSIEIPGLEPSRSNSPRGGRPG